MEILVSGVAGLLSHQIVFASGEWHLQATVLLKFYSLLYAVVIFIEASRKGSWQQGFLLGSLLCGVYAICLWGSMIVRRLFFHPLCDFPGPWLARTSKLWHVARSVDSKNHLVMHELYEKYGSFVRTGMVMIFFCVPKTGRRLNETQDQMNLQ